MSYPNRRYRVVDGKLAKRWDAPGDGWYVTKVEAWEAERVRVEKAAGAAKTAAARAAKVQKDKDRQAAKEAKAAEEAADDDVEADEKPKSSGRPVLVPPAEVAE